MNYLEQALSLKNKIIPPTQSNFRVFCLMILLDNNNNEYQITGTNRETCFIQGSICAERAALLQVLEKNQQKMIKHIYLVSDADNALTPGLLCREFLIEHCDPDVPITIADNQGQNIETLKLSELYPYPSLFIGLKKQEIQEFVNKLEIQVPDNDLYKNTMNYSKKAEDSWMHPMNYTCGVLFQDGKMAFSTHSKGLEYGCTVDAMESRRSKSILPVLLILVDQYGVMHSPAANARSYLLENGFSQIQILLHDKNGKQIQVSAEDIAPRSPVFGKSLSDIII